MQSDFGKLRLPQPLMRALCDKYSETLDNLDLTQCRRPNYQPQPLRTTLSSLLPAADEPASTKRRSRSWDLLLVPCLSIPFGHGSNGLPLSVQLVGGMGIDDDLLAAAKWIAGQLSTD